MDICLEMARQGYSSYHYYGKKKNRKKGERERTQQSNKSSMGSNKTHPVVKLLVLQTEDVGWCSVILLERRCPKICVWRKTAKARYYSVRWIWPSRGSRT